MISPDEAEVLKRFAEAVDHFGHVPTDGELRSFESNAGTLHMIGSPDGAVRSLLEHAEDLCLSDRVVEILRERV